MNQNVFTLLLEVALWKERKLLWHAVSYQCSDNSHIKVEDNLIIDKFYISGQFFKLFKFRQFEIVWFDLQMQRCVKKAYLDIVP